MEPLLAECCRHVAEGCAPILRAARGEDPEAPEWRFRCGMREHDPGDVRAVPLEELVRRDPTAVEIVLHPRGSVLERRNVAARWHTEAGPVLFPRRPSRRWPGLDPRFPPRPGEALETPDLRLLADVAERGWHTLVYEARPDRPGHAFSVGLFHGFDHPEIAVLGLSREALAETVDRIAGRVRAGERFQHGDVAEDIADGRVAAFRTIPPRVYPAWLGYALWYHDGARFPALQCVWADADGRFPWDPWFPSEARAVQPVLYEPELA
ncbi:DUF4262 domain-containing protein [Anaeromyxobacter oryzae]|uniref:DUF4262 domain-containing protein n=1 Tax=Anaeromyxobacter oryzae TaxID=2918170 RepID=A0ABM7X2K0_9BACT|nr:DUF4262 domain-containing protein [Anaeromyxobacter oryzae]BDG06025.1 hypothetical protein AMOR_50210 [Anaeromyxobacter oryzae]